MSGTAWAAQPVERPAATWAADLIADVVERVLRYDSQWPARPAVRDAVVSRLLSARDAGAFTDRLVEEAVRYAYDHDLGGRGARFQTIPTAQSERIAAEIVRRLRSNGLDVPIGLAVADINTASVLVRPRYSSDT